MKNLLEFILINLVQYPEAIQIEEFENESEVEYSIHVHPDDVGRVIGKGGSVINAIRQIAKVRAIKEQTRVRITVADTPRPETATAADSTAKTQAAEDASESDDSDASDQPTVDAAD